MPLCGFVISHMIQTPASSLVKYEYPCMKGGETVALRDSFCGPRASVKWQDKDLTSVVPGLRLHVALIVPHCSQTHRYPLPNH